MAEDTGLAAHIKIELVLGIVSQEVGLLVFESVKEVYGVQEVRKLKGSRGVPTVFDIYLHEAYSATFVRNRVVENASRILHASARTR